MGLKKILWTSVLILNLIGGSAYALDTDLYVLSGANIPPNVLVILDSSASMDDVSTGQTFDPGVNYALYSPPTVYPANAVYYKSAGNRWNLWRDDYFTIQCPDLQTILLQFGEAINYPVNSGTSECGGNQRYDLRTGNFRNYLQLAGGPGGGRPRFGLATGIIHSYVNTTMGVRFGLMVFNRDSGANTVRYDQPNKVEYVNGGVNDANLDANGARLMGFVDEFKTGKTELFNSLSGFKNDSWTPLAEALYEAGVYFRGGRSAITGTSYTSPVQYQCQKNYVLIISDGDPTKDNHAALSAIGDQDADGDIQLDDMAKYLYNLDLTGGTYTKKQNITTYTIGFSMTQTTLENAARKGGGKYYYVWSSQSFNIAFQDFIAAVLESSVSYVAPVVPISQMEKTSSGNRMYLAMFKPSYTSFWKGNIKKYGIATEKTASLKVGDILDANGVPVMDTDNQIKGTAISYWSSTVDGGEVEIGGVGELLLGRTTSRKIYTYLGTNIDLTNDSNLFGRSNNLITPLRLGLLNGDTTGRDRLIDFIHGLDAYDENGNGNVTEKRGWILGGFIHSRPAVVHYGTTRSVVYAGANDGMLHAFDDATGEELWGFVPPVLMPSLQNLTGEALGFFVDASPRVYQQPGKIVLMFGLRRGGDRYMALDITDPLVPKYMWEISPSSAGFGELGQTWSTPQIRKIRYGGVDKWVAIIGGGYDTNQDNVPAAASDTRGRGVYIFDILTGSLLWGYSNANDANMRHSIPSDITCVDTDGDGKIDRLYAGDMGGRMWRFDIGGANSSSWSGKILFNSNPGASDHRKIFYPPSVTLEKDEGNYEMVFFGTGDREHPKATTTVNRLYAIKDKNPATALGEADLVDVTSDLLQDPGTSEEQKTAILNALSQSKGWFIKLDQNSGEKCLANPLVFFGVVYFTTFTPSLGDPADVCYVGEGTGRLYALKYKTGNAAFNMDLSNDVSGEVLTRSDRSSVIGTAIPSGTIIAIIGGTASGYVGVGGGVYIPPLVNTKTLVPTYWRMVF